MNELDKKENYTNQSFEDIKHIDEDGIEYWYARELQAVLNYIEWRKFENVKTKQKNLVKIVILLFLTILSMSTKWCK